MYAIPNFREIHLAVSAASCAPSPDPYQECAEKGGLWLKTGGALPSCYTWAAPDEMVDAWLDYLNTYADCMSTMSRSIPRCEHPISTH